MRIAVLCVGNKLMQDDGIGCAVYDFLHQHQLPDTVELFDLGCLSMGLINELDNFDYFISVDAVKATDLEPGTIVSYAPYDLAMRACAVQSLHDLRLRDLFDAAALLGREPQGWCFGMQVREAYPLEFTPHLSAVCQEKVPELAECVLAKLWELGVRGMRRPDGSPVEPPVHGLGERNA